MAARAGDVEDGRLDGGRSQLFPQKMVLRCSEGRLLGRRGGHIYIYVCMYVHSWPDAPQDCRTTFSRYVQDNDPQRVAQLIWQSFAAPGAPALAQALQETPTLILVGGKSALAPHGLALNREMVANR